MADTKKGRKSGMFRTGLIGMLYCMSPIRFTITEISQDVIHDLTQIFFKKGKK